MTTTILEDIHLTPEDTEKTLLAAITLNTIKMFMLLLPDEDVETIYTITCSVMIEIFNRIDPRTESWQVDLRRKPNGEKRW